jgi:hypothetical protein
MCFGTCNIVDTRLVETVCTSKKINEKGIKEGRVGGELDGRKEEGGSAHICRDGKISRV